MSSDHDTGRLTIDKFTGKNFHLWKFKMQAMLKAKSLWSAIERTLPLDTADQDACRKEEKAMAALVLWLGDEQLMHVQNAATAAEVWRKLKEVHERKGIANKLYLGCKVLTVVMEDGDGMLEHINKVKLMAQQLGAIGAKLDNEDIINHTPLQPAEELRVTHCVSGSRADDLTLEFSGKDGRAIYGRSRIINPSMRKEGRPCFYCGKEGHFRKKCRKRLLAEQQSSEANQASGHEAFAFSATSSRGGHWIIDLGASQHMTSNRAWLSNLQPQNNAWTALPNGRTTTRTCKDVWLVPKLERSLLSVAQLEGAGANIQFVGGRCGIRTRKGALALSCDRQEGLYALGQPLDAAAQCHAVAASTTAATLETWHRRLGHLNCQSVQLMARNGLVLGVEAVGALETAPCSTCALGKATKLPFPKDRSSRASEVLELVHSDVCGPMRTLTIGGDRYFVLFIDNKSRAVFRYLLKTKAETLPSLKIFAAAAATETGSPLKVLQSDHGGEYLSKAFSNFTQPLGIQHQLSSVATPEQNGVAESMNRTLVEMARCLLLQAGLPYEFWAAQPMLPFSRKNQHKLGPSATRCIFLGYSQTTKGYRHWNKAAGKLIESRDVRFDEESPAGDPGRPDPAAQASTDELSDAGGELSQQGEAPEDASKQGDKLDGGSEPGEDFEDAQEHLWERSHLLPGSLRPPECLNGAQPASDSCLKSTGSQGLVSWLRQLACWLRLLHLERTDLPPFKAALKAPNARQWEQAAQTKLSSLHVKHTWDLVPFPAGCQPIKCKWVFKIKRAANSSLQRKGFSQ
ncbi:DNA-directed DNA polymerase [Powellomyces hirtus]|uniref:DNA-directed DNA polymerase n=1 Tax=Powellomyces hirtus TaxID=109895 RepID=A0A507DNU9_9FUNG|nr:DNA-directed DNA polymerase [Powellomyces hirtus]